MRKSANNFIKTVMLGALIFLSVFGYSQDYAQDMKRICDTFKSESLSYHVKYFFYPYDSVKKATDSMNINCNMSGQEYYYKVMSGGNSYEYYRNNKYFFVVDHTELAIAVRKNTQAQQQLWDMDKLDSLIHLPTVKITYKDAGSSEGMYVIKLSEGSWNKISIVFNKTTFRVSSIHLYSKNKGKMYGDEYKRPVIAIFYSDYTKTTLGKDFFSESRYFHDDNNGIVLADSYKKYKLLDYVHTSKTKN
jgi:hypothetical protein